jgi:hypothetical protein
MRMVFKRENEAIARQRGITPHDWGATKVKHVKPVDIVAGIHVRRVKGLLECSRSPAPATNTVTPTAPKTMPGQETYHHWAAASAGHPLPGQVVK